MPALAFAPERSRLQRLLVTRPEPEASAWAHDLRAHGWPAQALPLLEIAAAQDPLAHQALQRWRSHWLATDAIMFVSTAAVRYFFSDPAAFAPPPPGSLVRTRFWAPGPGTARALGLALAHFGISADRIDAPPASAAQFDSQALWPLVAARLRSGDRILIVRGHTCADTSEPSDAALADSGRDWLIRQCQAVGARVESCVAYERRAPIWSPTQRALAAGALEAGSAWLFSSSEAVASLADRAVPSAEIRAGALCTHPRIAAAARAAGFGQTWEIRPTLPDLLRALESDWSRP
ncbi:uroporphyrinogen-III synthase [Hydrogenophaga sp.]|uniref:uroporphyrinogen-III synthase n=1 Tax=Hydrogenophaga sp. TaxID=1904254 RepID=UPI0019962998|nr:uroporphyrinogen-III synthase [Hydrogenophaga sp.]MBD3893757.1 uroporphyrinogen-III synthase [Hydrogenophaga sp.]